MSYGNMNHHPSYHNRFRSSSNVELPIPEESESDIRNENLQTAVVEAPPSDYGHESTSPKSPEPRMSANSRRAAFMEARSMSGSSTRPLRRSTDSSNDDVFLSLDIGDNDVITDPVDIVRMVEKHQIKSTVSNTSARSVMPNPYNKFNHRIHSFFWCSCCFYFVFICCLPGVHYMQESDEAFKDGDDKKAQRLGKMATLMFIAGTILSLACYAGILFLVIFFTALK